MQAASEIGYGYVRAVQLPFERALRELETRLRVEGFGVLFQLDMQAKLREKLGIEFPRYVILGVCNPPLAHQALRKEIALGLLLPCNAIVYENGDEVMVGVVDAAEMLSVVGNPELEEMAWRVNEKLRCAVDGVAQPVG